MSNDQPPLTQLTDFLNQLTNKGYKHSTLIKDPNGKLQFFTSEEVTSELLNQLCQSLVRPNTMTSSTQHIVYNDNLLLHRAIDNPTFILNSKDTHLIETQIRSCLRELQQLPCKAISKALIRLIEPKKQSKHPYKRGESSRPPWWPMTIRHVEPDHLNMKERLTLMVELVLRSCPSVSAMSEVVNRVTDLNDYQKRLINEVLFIARAWRSNDNLHLVVSDWDSCSKGRKGKLPMFEVSHNSLQPNSQLNVLDEDILMYALYNF